MDPVLYRPFLKTAFLLATLTLPLTPGFADWDRNVWDPADSHPELTLPLPCGGSIAMRRVETPTDSNWLTDIPVRLGRPDSLVPYTDYIWNDRVVGALSDGTHPESRHFFMGVYEVTRRQYASVMDNCQAAMAQDPALPVDDTTWFDANAFLSRLNIWLLENHPDVLMSLGADSGYIRLPTEEEWEFAARGGIAVPDAETFQAKMYPMDGKIPLQRYAHHLGSASCNDKTQPIGKLRPNPLGLYDIVGNVQELVLDPFRLVAHGHLHGQAGGFVARGGSCLTPREEVATAQREEIPAIDRSTKKFYHADFTGFRIATGGVALPNALSFQNLMDDFSELSAFVTEDRTQATVDTILAHVDDEETKTLVKSLAADFRTEIAARERIHRRSVQLSIVSAAFLGRSYFVDSEEMRRYANRCNPPSNLTPEKKKTWDKLCADSRSFEERRKLSRSLYGDLLARMAEDVDIGMAKQQLPQALATLQQSNITMEFARLFMCHLDSYLKQPPDSLTSYFVEIENRDLSKCPH